jgi:hypothetical protein
MFQQQILNENFFNHVLFILFYFILEETLEEKLFRSNKKVSWKFFLFKIHETFFPKLY